MFDEGVIKFRAAHRQGSLETRLYSELACKLIAWREILAKTGLVGQRKDRYGGFGYGNVSGRVGPPGMPRGQRSFLITGTQTSGKECVSLGDFCVVKSYDDSRNEAQSFGPALPSSESLTHGAIYDLGPQIRFVLHGHTPTIWRRARELRIPTSEPKVAYGTPQMAAEVRRLYRSTSLAETKILAMGGHEDGVIVFGHSAEEAGQILLAYLARAFETDCRADGGLCSF
ncbi:MAG: class II aldolase/adducin family protein [Deltaproteobacteria bacterium]|nr:class II aldolase/adducin family protein [Deltaproteobacteria bacterium]